MELPKQYNPHDVEKKWQKYWLDHHTYKFNENSKKEIYSLDTPPPTVSGSMHPGHAMAYSQADAIMRYKRMKGYEIFYPWGFDDNGLATERFVEKKNNVKSTSMSRKEFVDLCLKTTKEAEEHILNQFLSVGLCPDLSLTYRTVEPRVQKISQISFIELYEMGREYRKQSPTMWCPVCQTAISQVELKDQELKSVFNDIVFKVDGKDIIIATTRPELLPACVAVFYHPEDKRYHKLKGKKAKVPLFNMEVPILEDPRVAIDKGTGIVMCCTFGDQTDIEWYKAHNLQLRIAITTDGKMNELAGKYAGKKIKEARQEIIEDLKASKLLITQKDITHPVNVHERCDTPIEFMVTWQWFIKYLDLKDEFLKLGNELKWHPQYMKSRYDNWVKGLQWDWCISRQRFFGVPIPVWYCDKCGYEVIAKKEQLPVDPLKEAPPIKQCPKCKNTTFTPEKDVLDTWATSSLTAMIPTRWKEDDKFFKKIYPMSLRANGHDIITFWLFNAVVKSYLHEKTLPWKDAFINGFLVDSHGEKMSKSRGNYIEPETILTKFCADALRYWSTSYKLGEDLQYSEKELNTGMKLLNKLWNASKFCIMHLERYDGKKPKELHIADKWLLSELQSIIGQCTQSFEEFEFSRARAAAENFFWHTFCDNYMEMVKYRLYGEEKFGKDAKESAQYTIYTTLLAVLKLLAPIMCHATEEIYSLYFKEKEKIDSIHLTEWPKIEKALIQKDNELGEKAVDVIARIRKYKSEKALSQAAEVNELIIDDASLKPWSETIQETVRALKITFGKASAIETETFKIKIEIR